MAWRSNRRVEVADKAALTELRNAELRAERLSAGIRAIVFFALLVVFASIDFGHEHDTYVTLSLTIYGAVTAVAAFLAWRRWFHPALAYALVTVDVMLVAAQLTLLVRVFDLPHALAYSIPAAGLIFLVLAQATLRFRPSLVLYAAALFIVVLEGSRLFLSLHSHAPDLLAGRAYEPFLYGHALPLSVIGLTALALWAVGSETRRMLGRAIEQAGIVASLSRFFTPTVAARVAELQHTHSKRGDRRQVAILFVDIQAFSRLAQRIPPDALADLLTEFRDVVTRPVFALDGAIDKFIGDGALIVFGSPDGHPDDAARAIQCGRRVLDSISIWSARRAETGQPTVRVGIGGHYGEVFAGILGSHQQLEFTVIGDVVNIAERIERLTREYETDMVISQELMAAARAQPDNDWWRLPLRSLPGHGVNLELFALAARAGPSQPVL